MKHFRGLSIGAAIFLCLCLFAPMNSQAASSGKSHSKNHIVKKSSSKKERIAKSDERLARVKSEKKTRKSAKAGSSKSVMAKSDQPDRDESDRLLWQKRASESQLLTGKASWYGRDFHNKATASGLDYDMYTFTAAHRTLPMGTVVKVTDQQNGKSVMVCVTDRGPFVRGRIIDVSYAAAKQLDLNERGVGNVKLEVVSDENGSPLKPDQAYFIRYVSENGGKKVGPFKAFADAMAMHEALRQAHPEAEVVLEKAMRP